MSNKTLFVLVVAFTTLVACGTETRDDPGGGDGGDDGTMKVEGANATLSVTVTGTDSASKTLILLHGGPGLSSDYMKPLEALADGDIRVVRFDQRGMGGSSTPDPPSYTLDDYVADLDAVRAALGAETIHLLAHSWGGMIGWAYLAAHPSRVASLISAGGLAPSDAPNYAARLRLEERIVYLQGQGFIPNPLPPDQGDDCGARNLAVLPAYVHDYKFAAPEEFKATQCRPSVFLGTYDAVFTQPIDFNSIVAGYAGPSFVIFGKSDPLGVQLGEASVQALVASQPKMVVLPASGHYPWFETPDFLTHVRDFLTALP